MAKRMTQRHRREKRRAEAIERQAKWDSYDLQTKLEIVALRGGSQKEWLRLKGHKV